MYADYLIIGQGISGTWLSYFLEKNKSSFIAIDNNDPNAPSRLAAGIINPVTGRRHVTAWMIEELLPFAWQAYSEMGNSLGIKAISQKEIIDFFPSAQMRQSFQQRVEENAAYVSLEETLSYNELFNYELGYGKISPVYTAHLDQIIPAWRTELNKRNQLLQEPFDQSQLIITTNGIRYKEITAEKIIFCDGAASVKNPYFNALPFAPNKGEALTLEIQDISPDRIYKKGMMLVPLATPGHWWIGSDYQWDFNNLDPSPEFREKTEQLLKQWLKVPYRITGHIASNRPATIERRPFVGLHPIHPQIGILNGMGTKGCSLAPFFARQLADYFLLNTTITAEADVKRFTRILSHNIS
jgi:glycine/D-amino acid oxidase-like deaminating enzyme